MTVFLDTAVLMHAAGREHAMRAPCAAIIGRVSAGELDAVISAEVVQEIMHRYTIAGRPDVAVDLASFALDLFSPVLPVRDSTMQRSVELLRRYPQARSRDLVHVATCVDQGIETIVSPDTHFDDVREIRRIAPEDAGRLGS